MPRRSGLPVRAAATFLLVSPAALASGAFEIPDNGTEQYARGGAWVARATDPYAVFVNPAALAAMPTSASLNMNLIWKKTCFKRVDANGQPERLSGGTGDLQYPEQAICNDNAGSPFPNPLAALAWRVSPKLGVGFAIGGPSNVGHTVWPEVVGGTKVKDGSATSVPSPQRYMLTEDKGLVMTPMVAAGYEVTPELRVGAGFIWGIAILEFTNIAMAIDHSDGNTTKDDYQSDVKAHLKVKDLFFPGAVAGALWSPSPHLDVGAWWHWSDAIRAKGDVRIVTPYYKSNGDIQDPAKYDCDTPNNPPCTDTTGQKGTVTIYPPMQFRLGTRLHQPRNGAAAPGPSSGLPIRDPLSQDVFDIELDFSYARNSSGNNMEIRFEPNIQVAGTPGWIPENADVPHHLKDVFGVRLGGDYVIVPGTAAIRAGGFYESEGQDSRYLNVDFVPARRFGLTAGATYRLFDRLDAKVGFGTMFPATLDNKGNGQLRGLAGNISATPDQRPSFRTANYVNRGSITQTATILSLGVAYRF